MDDYSITLPKRCSKCGDYYQRTSKFFYKHIRQPDGLTARCKKCINEDTRKYRVDNPEKYKEIAKNYGAKNRERATLLMREWRKNNPERVKTISKRGRIKKKLNTPPKPKKPVLTAEEKKERKKQYGAKRRLLNPEQVRQAKAKSYQKNKDHAREYQREDRKKHPEKSRMRVKARARRLKNAIGTFSPKDVQRLYDEQEGLCAYCGIRVYITIAGDTHVDHIFPLARGGTNWPDNLCIACQTCNVSKGDSTVEEWIQRRGW